MRIVRLDARPLNVPLREPFVIANAEMQATRAALVHVRLVDDQHHLTASGIGEAASLWPITKVDQPDVLRHIARAEDELLGAEIDGHSALEALLDDALGHDPVARSGVEQAILDAWARLIGVPAYELLGSVPVSAKSAAKSVDGVRFETDVTIPIGAPDWMGEKATWWRAMGFKAFKVKVGKNADDDARALEAIKKNAPEAEVRLDGNEGLEGRQAMALLARARKLDLHVSCFEQPCARDDEEGMAFVTELAGCPVIADESVRDHDDLDRIIQKKTARGVNLKLVKLGGAVKAGRLGREAKRRGLKVMMGAMVETRLGLSMSAHVVRALGGVDYVDLDTALLLKGDPFTGGYEMDGAVMSLVDGAGVTVSEQAQA
jgi:L-alanine-DL-glutamate epimerase-like enolase superfamily enzyme